MSCILTSSEAKIRRANLVAAAAAVGSMVMPQMNEYCESCGTQHTVEMEGGAVAKNYGQPPVDVHLNAAEEKEYSHYQHKSYCEDCMSYHITGNCRGARGPQDIGALS